jgi:hypothetical protein
MVSKMVNSKIRAWARMLLDLFHTRSYPPRRLAVRSDSFCPANPATAILVEEVGRNTSLISHETMVAGPYTPEAAQNAELAFPIDVYSQVFRELAISQAVVGVACAIDQNGERAIRGEQPDGKRTLLLVTAPLGAQRFTSLPGTPQVHLRSGSHDPRFPTMGSKVIPQPLSGGKETDQIANAFSKASRASR